MCFLSYKTKRILAKSDVPIFKMVIANPANEAGVFESPFYKFNYTLGVQTPKINLEPKPVGSNSIILGPGYYVFPVDAFYISTYMPGKSLIRNCKTNWGYYVLMGTMVACIGIIPKGTYYYRNDIDEIVAESIMLTRKVEPADYSNLNSLT